MSQFRNECNLRYNDCTGEWRNDSVEANEYTIDLPIRTIKRNMCDLIVELKYRRFSKRTKDDKSNFAITSMVFLNIALFCETTDESLEMPACLWCHLPQRVISPKEGKMMKQMSFKLNEHEELQSVWNRLPESNQREIRRLYAKLIAQAAKSEIYAEAKEKGGGDVE
jgi:hypothetical protein